MTASVVRAPASNGRAEDVWGRRRVHTFQVTLDDSYPTGGEVLGLAGWGTLVQEKQG